MTRMSLEQVISTARAGGLTDSKAVAVAAAIAGWSGSPNPGESGGDPTAVGDVNLQTSKWGPSVGLWQVRSLRAETGTGQARDVNRLTDPTFNARSMVEISSGGTNWQPWSVYTSGKYEANISAALAAVGAIESGQKVAADDDGGFLGTASSGIEALTSSLGSASFWARVGAFLGGAALLVLAARILGRDILGDVVKRLR